MSDIEGRIRNLEREVAGLRVTNRRLNRRCQRAEAGVVENIERCRRAGVSLGRCLANAGYMHLEKKYGQLKDERDELRRSRDHYKRAYIETSRELAALKEGMRSLEKREADSATEGPGDIVRKELKLARKIIIVRGYRECPFRHGVVCRVTGSQLGCYPMGKWPKGAERCPLTQYADVVVRREKRRQAVRKERGPWWLWGVAGAFVAAGAALLGYGAAMVWRYLW